MDWLPQTNYMGAFLVGLLGGVHCVGMCGGIVTALTFNAPSRSSVKTTSHITILLGYNLGRIVGYMIAGALVGGLGAGLLSLTDLQTSKAILSTVAALFMVALGLYIAGIWRGIASLEKAGQHVWKHIEPVSRRFIPATHFYKAFPLGLLWGWLPCGLVYTILIWTLSAGSWLEGALLMLAFGLGTLPNLLAIGMLAQSLSRWTQAVWVRRIAGLIVGGLGVLMLFNFYHYQ